MKAFNNMVDAINDLRARGFDMDFNLRETELECTTNGRNLSPDEFDIVEVFRFEGMTNPSDQSILYAIESHDGLKGVLVNGYGPSADPISQAMVAKLATHPQQK
jgi:hypothetical protein